MPKPDVYMKSILNSPARVESESHPWQVIQTLEFLKNESPSFMLEVFRMFKSVVFEPGEIIVQQGAEGDGMYFMQEGHADVWLDDQLLAKIGAGIPFGEMALLSGEKRMATVRALTWCITMRLSKRDFDTLRSRYPRFDSRIQALVKERLVSNSMRAS